MGAGQPGTTATPRSPRHSGLARAGSPESGGAVMATGIVSVAMHADGQALISDLLLAIAVAAWALLGARFLRLLTFDRARWRGEARRPSALTAVAATAVLGTRLTLLGSVWAGWVLLAIATVLWVSLMGALRGQIQAGQETGAGFLLVVAPQSLAVLCASLGIHLKTAWPALVALVPFALALGVYPVVLKRFDLRQLRAGAGEHWIAGGALAISCLACADIAQAITLSNGPNGMIKALQVATVVLWALTMAWLPFLIGGELRWWRPAYDVRRWATVFPLGMYAVMSVATGAAAGAGGIVQFGKAWAWVALTVWAAAAVGLTRGIVGATPQGWARRDPAERDELGPRN